MQPVLSPLKLENGVHPEDQWDYFPFNECSY